MTSQVTEQLTGYVANYPVAGQDNDSQQFRTNFSLIQTALSTVDSEITNLQNNTAKTNTDTDFNSKTITNAFMVSMYGTVKTNLNPFTVTDGTYFVFNNILANTNLDMISWPSSGTEAKEYNVRIHLVGTGSWEVTFRSNGGSGLVYKDDSGQFTTVSSGVQKITLESNKVTVVDAWSVNDGGTVFLKYIGKFQQ